MRSFWGADGSEMNVRYPELRERLRSAAHELRDEEIHDRLWVRGVRHGTDHELGFEDTLLVFIDELDTFGPGDLVGNLVIDEREAEAVQDLQDAIWALVERTGTRASYRDVVATGEVWEKCKDQAAQLELLLGRA
jgi:hypothetical protein